MTEAIEPDVLAWAGRVRPGTQVASCTVRPLAGGDVADRVEQMTLHLAGGGRLELVYKNVPAHEIAGLRAAQAVRPEATAVPELVAAGPHHGGTNWPAAIPRVTAAWWQELCWLN